MRQQRRFQAEKTHFRLYKAKKNWLVAGITLFGFGVIGGVSQANTVQAATTAAATVATNESTTATDANTVAQASASAAGSGTPTKVVASSASSGAPTKVAASSASSGAPTRVAASSTSSGTPVKVVASSASSSAPAKVATNAASSTVKAPTSAVAATPAPVAPAATTEAPTSTVNTAARTKTSNAATALNTQSQVAPGVQVKTQVAPAKSVGSLTEASAATPLDVDNLGQPRNVVVTVEAQAGDTITLDVPWLFSAVSDQVMTVAATKIPATQTDQTKTEVALKDTLLTYHATAASIQTFNVTLTAQDVLGGLNDQATFSVILAVNGVEQDRLTYTVAHAVTASFKNVTLDHNQTGTLVTNQAYVYGIKLGHTGMANRWSGQLSVAVPADFELIGGADPAGNTDYSAQIGDTTAFGSTSTTQEKAANLTQPGGAGTPILITATEHYLSYDGYSFYLWGRYQTPVAQADNTFTVTGALNATTDKGRVNGGSYQTSTAAPISGSTTIPVAVTANEADQKVAVEQINLNTGSALQNNQGHNDTNNVYLDPIEPDGTKQSDDTSYSYTDATRSATILNTGNVAQTNAKLVINVPAGTEAIKAGPNSYYYAFDTDLYNPLASIVLTTADGEQKTYTGADLDSNHRLYLSVGEDGSQVVKIAATWTQVLAGKEVGIAYMNNAMTAGKIGDTITQTMTYTSDQLTTPLTATKKMPIVAVPAVPLVTEVGPYFVDLNQVYRPGDKFDLQFWIKTSREAHLGTYYITLPREFDLTDIKWYGVSGLAAIQPDVTDLGYSGTNGEHVLKVDLSKVTSDAFIVNDVTGISHNAGFAIGVQVNADALPLTQPIAWRQMVQIQNADDYTRTSKQEPTIEQTYGSETATVIAPQVTADETWTYQIVLPANLTALNGIDDPATSKVAFVTYDPDQAAATTAHFDKGATTAATDDQADTQIRLLTYNGTDQTTPWTQNLVILPRVATGAAFDVTLTGAGKIAQQSTANAAKLLYTTQAVNVTADTQIDTSQFVTAADVKDWSQVQAVLLTTDTLAKADVIQALLPVTVPNIEAAPIDQDNLVNTTFMAAKSDGTVYQQQQPLNAQVSETTTVTTHWVTEAPDGTQTDIQPAQTISYQTGAAYTTAALAATAIPAGYRLAATPTNAVGTTVRAGVTVTYVYVADQQAVVVHYIDVSASPKTTAWTAADGTELTSAAQNLAGQSETAYQNTLAIPTGYRLAAAQAYDAGAVAGTYDSDSAVTQNYYVYVVQDQQTATVTYVDQDADNAVLKTDTLTGTSNSTQDYSQVRNAVQSGFEALGYVYVKTTGNALDANNVVTFDSDTTKDQNTIIYLKHGIVPVTPDQPRVPGDEIPNNPNKWPKGTDQFALNKTVTETVQYVYQDGGKVASDQHQQVTFQQVAIVDKVTGTLLGYLAPADLKAYQADPTSVTLSDDAWTATNGDTLASLTSPAGKAGYTADLAATEDYTVTPTTGDLALTVTYTPDTQKATVTYVDLDADNAVLKTDTLTGTSNSTQDYSQVRHAIQSGFEALGYVYVRATGNALDANNSVTFDSDTTKNQSTTIYLKHDIVPVTPDQPRVPGDEIPNNPNKWPKGTDQLDLNKNVTEMVQYVYSNGGKVAEDQRQSVAFQRVAIVDKVTGALLGYLAPDQLAAYQADPTSVTLSDDAWTAVNGDTFTSVTSPAGKAGYTADLAATGDYTVTPTTGDLVLTVTYVPDAQKATVTYVDQDADNAVLKTDTLTGTSNSTQDYSQVRHAVQSGFEQLGYVYVKTTGDALDANNSVTFDSDTTKNQSTTIYLKHGIVPVTPDQPRVPGDEIPNNPNKWPQGTDQLALNKTVTETVQYVYQDGGKVAPDQHQQVTFHQVAIVDKVTGALLGYLAPADLKAYQADPTRVTLSDQAWTAVNGNTLASLTSPAGKAGYTADLTATEVYQVTPNTGDLALTITYAPDAQKATVTYVDQDADNAVLKTDTLTGTSNSTQDYSQVRHAIQSGFEKLGYIYVKATGDALDTNNVVTFDSDTTKDQSTTIYLKHGIVPVTPDQPQTPGDKIPHNPNKWPQGTDQLALNKTVTETVQYVYRDGGKVAPDQHQQVTFHQVAIVDKVTGALLGYLAPDKLAAYQADPTSVTLSDQAWTATNGNTLASLTSPAGKTGYTADLAATEVYQVTPNTGDLALTVTYTPDTQKATVTYVDQDADNAVLKTDTLTGTSNSTQDYSQVRHAIQSGFEALGYVYVKATGNALDTNNVVTFDSDTTKDQNTTIYLQHGIVPVTPDQPQTPGDKIPHNPNNWPKGVATQDLVRTVTERIQYIYAQGGKVAPDYQAQLTFQRVAIVDRVTGDLLGYLAPDQLAAYQAASTQVTLTDNGWTPSNTTTFVAVNSPVKAGFSADRQQVKAYQVTPNTGDLALVVTYTAVQPEPDLPGTPNVPETPTPPSTPSEPNVPNEPETPTPPSTPSEPNVPNEPETPTPPNTPNEPNVPNEPETPTPPSTPSEPNVPNEPETPTPPATPTESKVPNEPNTPIQPDLPSVPKTPTPGQPSMPAKPAIPARLGTSLETEKAQAKQQLPQTGTQNDAWLAELGLTVLGTVGLLGATQLRKRHDGTYHL